MASSDADVVGRVLEASGLILDRARLIGSRRSVVVAVSGGADSLCALDVMMTLLERAKRRVIVGHVDHCLREESRADAEHVVAVAGRYGVRCEILRVDVPALAAAERRGIEEAARLGRYRALRELSSRVGRGPTVTGHTRDDSVETVLMHLLRGTGRRGLSGLSADDELTATTLGQSEGTPWQMPLRVVRPLLDVGHEDTLAYCQARSIPWRLDPSNTDTAMLRNRVRHHLLPVLRTYNADVGAALSRLAATVQGEEELLETLTTRQLARLVVAGQGRASIDLAAFQRRHVALRRRVVRRCVAALGHTELGFEAVERALAVGEYDGPPRVQLGGGIVVERKGDRLVFSRESAGRPAEGES
ncbi:MAG: tRNA lysidine(34) synthetase TilS [Chloroflexota bacterium]